MMRRPKKLQLRKRDSHEPGERALATSTSGVWYLRKTNKWEVYFVNVRVGNRVSLKTECQKQHVKTKNAKRGKQNATDTSSGGQAETQKSVAAEGSEIRLSPQFAGAQRHLSTRKTQTN